MDDEDIDDIVVTIGTNDLRNGFKHSLGSVHIYADWAMGNNEIPDEYLDDICILKLKERVRDERIVPVSLKYDVLYVKQTVTLAGWGASDNDKTIPRFMETISLPVQPMQECNRKLEKIVDYKVVELPMLYLCTFTDPEALLRCGDSGGPVLNENNELIAINDATCPLENNHPGLVNLHVNVYFYKKFIEATLRNEN
ncbi:chymotrypsin-1-like [Trichogramma pretiosum]|uniref:chymotrypsin-1-like n=1 Tax=Trichogramma pretiosum TaxID=7493 RepID=UPI000C71AD82|nr:chymotrypsin-1-like [Trichogramma pretiosum]